MSGTPTAALLLPPQGSELEGRKVSPSPSRSREFINVLERLDLQRERHVTCAVTGDKFPISQKKLLQRRQIREAAQHLAERQVELRGFDRPVWLAPQANRLQLFDNLVVSPEAYNVYLEEKNLQDQEKIFARSVLHSSAPLVCERTLPPEGAATMISKMLFTGMFIEVVKIECPSALLDFGSKFELQFRLCEQQTQIRFEVKPDHIPPGGGPLNVDEVRMSWFFCADEGINQYLQRQQPLQFSLYNSTENELAATFEVDLSEVAARVVLHQDFRVQVVPAHQNLHDELALQFVHFHINVGCIKFREVDTARFRLRRRQGLFFPSSPFITECLPPDGWDPCNEEYINTLRSGQGMEADNTALSKDGTLIPRSRAGQHLIQQEQAGWAETAKTIHARRSRSTGPRVDTEPRTPVWLRTDQTTGPVNRRPRSGSLPPNLAAQPPARPASAPASKAHPSPSRSKSASRIPPSPARRHPPSPSRHHARPESGASGRSSGRPPSGLSGSKGSEAKPKRRRPLTAIGVRGEYERDLSPHKRAPAPRALSSGLTSPMASPAATRRPESAPPRQEGLAPIRKRNKSAKRKGLGPDRERSPSTEPPRPVSALARTWSLRTRRPPSAPPPSGLKERKRPVSALQVHSSRIAAMQTPSEQQESASEDGGERSPLSPNQWDLIEERSEEGEEWGGQDAEALTSLLHYGHKGSIASTLPSAASVALDDSLASRASQRTRSGTAPLVADGASDAAIAAEMERIARRPVSAMGALGRAWQVRDAEEETNDSAAVVLASITRPRSSLQRPMARCLEGLGNDVPSFRAAWHVAKANSTAGLKGSKKTRNRVLSGVEAAHESWRSNITVLDVLEDDLRSLDTRSRLVAFREKTLVTR